MRSGSCGEVPEGVKALAVPAADRLPQRLLYSTSSGLGGTGLNTTSLEGVMAAEGGGFLERVLCYENDQNRVPARRLKSLNWHPVRFLSFLESQRYYGAKKRYVAWMAERALRSGRYDCFHSWSGDCFRSLIEARRRGIPSVMDIPTWHRNKGKAKSGETRTERESRLGRRRSWLGNLEISRLQMLAEYDLADLILVPSKKSAETFLAAGVPEEKLHYVARGVDPERYRPGQAPEVFRACFVGALIERKGVHLLLEAWHRLGLKNAELVLVGTLHDEMKPHLDRWAADNVRVVGFTPNVQEELRRSAVFVFPSECEGFAKSTLEAAACGLPLIATRESGDAVQDGVTGLEIPANDVNALAAALERAAGHRDEFVEMGRRGRQRIEECLTWDHYRLRLLNGYARVMEGRR
jgi:glycosyltransferase involved in cell wall biosynthesis